MNIKNVFIKKNDIKWRTMLESNNTATKYIYYLKKK